jgi:hypothetical protein
MPVMAVVYILIIINANIPLVANIFEVFMNKKFFIFLICLTSIINAGCGGERKVNGRSNRVAALSVKKIKNYLPNDQRVPFEVGFWTIKAKYGNSDEFLDAVDGKTVSEIIASGQQIFEQRRAEGFEAYNKYDSWDDMIAKLLQERADQAIPYKAPTEQDKQNNVLYKLDNI